MFNKHSHVSTAILLGYQWRLANLALQSKVQKKKKPGIILWPVLPQIIYIYSSPTGVGTVCGGQTRRISGESD